MNLDVQFKKEPLSMTSAFRCYSGSKWLHLWVDRFGIVGVHPLTYTIQEALEDFCEAHEQVFKGINFVHGNYILQNGTYTWRRP